MRRACSEIRGTARLVGGNTKELCQIMRSGTHLLTLAQHCERVTAVEQAFVCHADLTNLIYVMRIFLSLSQVHHRIFKLYHFTLVFFARLHSNVHTYLCKVRKKLAYSLLLL